MYHRGQAMDSTLEDPGMGTAAARLRVWVAAPPVVGVLVLAGVF